MPKAGSASAPDRLKTARPHASFQAADRGLLGRNRRVRKSAQFGAILKSGSRGPSPLLAVVIVPATGPGRIGISASTKVGGSVVRNRARRLVKECYRRMFYGSAPHDLVVTIDPRIVHSSVDGVSQALHEAISKAVARRSSAGRRSHPGD